jgi:hypothetical protein
MPPIMQVRRYSKSRQVARLPALAPEVEFGVWNGVKNAGQIDGM